MPGIDGLQVLEEARKVQPEAAVVIMTAYATVDTAVAAMKIGAYDYLVKPFDPEELSLMIQKIVTQQALVRENVLLRKVLKRDYHFRDLISKSPAMQAVFDLARTAARSHSTILILGESGTGKELLARAIHAESPRSQGAVRRRVVRGAHRDAARVGAVRPREGRVHRRGGAAQGQVRDGRTAARCSSTRSATSARSCSSTCCACSRTASSSASAATSRSPSTSGSSPPPTATCRRRWPTDRSARTSSTA